MTVKTLTIQITAKGNTDIQDITSLVAGAIHQSQLTDGVAVVFCPSSTSGVTTVEYEPGCVADLQRMFEEIVSSKREYAHNARWGDGNGHSHVRASLLGPSLSVPFVGGRPTLGTWQQIIYIDFDIRPRDRELVVQILGE